VDVSVDGDGDVNVAGHWTVLLAHGHVAVAVVVHVNVIVDVFRGLGTPASAGLALGE
jgi:hypothetical protein